MRQEKTMRKRERKTSDERTARCMNVWFTYVVELHAYVFISGSSDIQLNDYFMRTVFEGSISRTKKINF